MADHKSIASEIFSWLKVHDYNNYCPCIIERDAVRMQDYHSLAISNSHYIDLRYCFIDNVFNPCHVLDYFAQYSGLNCHELRKQVIDLVKEDRDHWVHVASIVLPLRLRQVACVNGKSDYGLWWVFLFILSRMHYQHTVVYTMKRSWTTLCVYGSMSEEEIHVACDLHLIYLGQDVYSQLVPTIMPSTHIQTSSITPGSTVPIAPNASHTRQEK